MKTCPTCDKQWPDEFRLCPSDGSSLRTSSSGTDLVDSIIADRYHISRKLGAGGMGTVYLGEHIKMGQQAAIKVITRDLASDPAAIARFTREARNAARIKHPNVCTIYDFGETPDGLIYMAMEFIDGESLADLLQREGRLSPHRAADLLMQCCDALQAAHDLDIVHRDMKPENIMIAKARDGSDVVKVVDFGIAKAVTGGPGQTVTQTGFIVGTPDYMSPDQVSGQILDGRSDIYSLAVVFFRMVTGTLPFPSTTPQEALMARLGAKPMSLKEALPASEFSRELQDVLDQALEQRRENRFATASDFGKAILGAVGGEPDTVIEGVSSVAETQQLETPQPRERPGSVVPPASARPRARTPETPQPSPSPVGAKSKAPKVAALVGAVVVVGALAVVWRVTSTDSTAGDNSVAVVIAAADDSVKGDDDEAKPDATPTGAVSISGLPEGGTIIVLGQQVESPFALPAGPHDIELRAPGYEPKTVSVTVVAGERMTVIYASRRLQEARTRTRTPTPPTRPAGAPTGERVATVVQRLGGMAPGNRRLAMGETGGGVLSATSPTYEGRHVQAWALRASPGTRVDITMRSNEFDPFLYLVGPGLSQPLTDDDGADGNNARIRTTLARGGTYLVIASQYSSGSAGTYTLSVTQPGAVQLSTNRRTLTLGQTVTGTLTGNEEPFANRRVQAWSLRVAPGTRVKIDLESAAFDAYLYVAGPGLDDPIGDDDGGEGTNSRITALLSEGGTYTVMAAAYGNDQTGPFTLRATALPSLAQLPKDGRTLTPGTSVSGTLRETDPTYEGRHVRVFELRAASGTRVQISMSSGEFDTYLYLIGPGIAEPITDDDGGDGTNSQISATLTQGGTYYVAAGGYDGEATGAYRLSVSRR